MQGNKSLTSYIEFLLAICRQKMKSCDGLFVHRLEFDAYRSDLEELSLGPRDAAAMVRIEMAQHDYQVHRDKYERLRSDVTIKLKFLEENKVLSILCFLDYLCLC